MHHSRLAAFVIDCKAEGVEEAARFWSAALGREIAPPAADAGLYRDLKAADGEAMILIQAVSHESRIHLDIEADDLEAEVKRLETLGAKRIGFVKRWWVLEAPTGQRFCVVKPQRGPLADKANEWK